MNKKTLSYIYLTIGIIFTILTFTGVILILLKKVNNAGYSVIPMLFGVTFISAYRNTKSKIE